MAEPRQSAPKSRDEVAAAYKSEPWWYDLRGLLILTFAYNSTLGAMLRRFGPNFGARHIEVACGTGTLLDMMLRWRKRRGLAPTQVVAIDYADSMLAGARSRFAGRPEVLLELADAAQLPFEASTFDTANIANAVHCLPDVDGALNEVHRVLVAEGTVCANVLLFPMGPAPLQWVATWINGWGMRKGILTTPYHVDDIRGRFEKAGFSIVEEAVRGNTWNVLARKSN